MYVKRNYSFFMTFNWSKKPFLLGLLYALAIHALIYFVHGHFTLPWQPISVIGIAVAFYLGFKNNSSYDRTWEARKIWGGIVNTSRSFGAGAVSFIQGEDAPTIRRELIHRHVAWLTVLRHQLRMPRTWEHPIDGKHSKNLPNISEAPGPKCTMEMEKFTHWTRNDQPIRDVSEPMPAIIGANGQAIRALLGAIVSLPPDGSTLR